MKFLKLTNIILNVRNINKISIKPNKYYINYNNNINGGGFMFCFTGSMNINSGEELEICKTENPNDYITITKLIESINIKIDNIDI
jgi:hypothetical protein